MTEPTKEPITKVAILSKKSLDVFNCHNNLTHELSGSTTGIPRLYHNVFIPEKGGKPHKADLSGAGFSLKMSFDQAKEAVEEALTKGKIDARIGTAWVDGGELSLPFILQASLSLRSLKSKRPQPKLRKNLFLPTYPVKRWY